MKTKYDQRLAEMRAQWMIWSATTDTSTWESTLFFKVLDEKERALVRLRKALHARLKVES